MDLPEDYKKSIYPMNPMNPPGIINPMFGMGMKGMFPLPGR